MSGTTIREAKESDANTVIELLEQLFERGIPSAYSRDDALKVFKKLLTHGPWKIIVAEEGHTVQAFLTIYFLELMRFGKRGYIEDMIVDKRLRGSGVGTRLMEYAESLARREGCTHLALDTGFYREQARNFYRKVGFQETAIALRKDLV